jgi:DnaK suppressor protein
LNHALVDFEPVCAKALKFPIKALEISPISLTDPMARLKTGHVSCWHSAPRAKGAIGTQESLSEAQPMSKRDLKSTTGSEAVAAPSVPAAGRPKLPPGYRPDENEPFMNERQRLYFRQKLTSWREEIVEQTRETLVGLHDDTAQHADITDRATSETDRALELRARDRQRKLVSKIDAALGRLDDGSYGYCEETGEPIATLSLEAQERHERREKVYREE